jgi:hypothetical protein
MDAGYNSISLFLFLVPYKRNADEQFSISIDCRPLFPPYIFKNDAAF